MIFVSLKHKMNRVYCFSFQFYEGGVFDVPNCYNKPSRLTHSMLIIGYGTYKGKDYWLVKNRYTITLEPKEGAHACKLFYSLQLGNQLGYGRLHHDG